MSVYHESQENHMNKMGMTLCLSLAAFLPCGVMQAADIDPIAQHQAKERAQVRETMDRYTAEEKAHRREDARALGRELLLAGGDRRACGRGCTGTCHREYPDQ